MNKLLLTTLLAISLVINSTASDEKETLGTSDGKIKFTGFVSSVGGKFIRYHFTGEDYKMLSVLSTLSNLNMHLKVRDNLTLHLGVECMTWYNQFNNTKNMLATERMGPFFNSYIDRAEGVFSLCSNDVCKLDLGIGYFPYKYNQDAQNLGEYLFRTGMYPPWIKTTFDWPVARISGLRFSASAWGVLKNDLLVTREVEMWPFNDVSITDIASVSFANIIDIGGGVMLGRSIPANGYLTMPRNETNQRTADSTLIRIDTTITPMGDTSIIPLYDYERTYYTHAGTKLMARATIDPKGILPLLGIDDYSAWMKKNDGKIYGEVAILGLKNQPPMYDTIKERMPIMFGMNWFTHPFVSYPLVVPALAYGITDRNEIITGILDTSTGATAYDTIFSNKNKVNNAIIGGVFGIAAGAASWVLNRYLNIDGTPDLIAMELEYFPNPWPNNYQRCQNMLDKTPALPNPKAYGNYTAADYLRRDDWKWSVYFNKTIAGHFIIIGQIARDHSRLLSNNFGNTDYEEVLTRPNQYYWMGKLAYNF